MEIAHQEQGQARSSSIHHPGSRDKGAAAAAANFPAQAALMEFFSPRPRAELEDAATKVQKLFRGHRTRRNMAEWAIVIEELWWKAYESASLNIKSISSFDEAKQETAASRWSRAGKMIRQGALKE